MAERGTPPGTPWWRPDRFALRRARLEARARIVAATRTFFAGRDFIEVETPALQVSPGMEPHLRAFRTELHAPGAGSAPRYLHTSPEFAMKKLLVAGLPRIWQMARVFRDGERSATHHPEFAMLEWYRAGAGYEALIDDCAGLLRAALAAAGTEAFIWQGRACDPRAPFERLSVAEAFRRYADGLDILATAPDPLSPSLDRLAAGAQPLGIAPRPGDRWDDLFFRIFLDRIEPQLGNGRATILYDYPASMAALARPKPGDARLAERFELYVCGLELANAFGELTDAAEQRRRFVADMDIKQRLYGLRYPADEDFLAALAHGMPESAGIALGFDRLAMLATGAAGIEDVLWAPVAEPEGE
ncbi:MAG: EF-P lysine aminoacylase GenX [Rhodospirillales bacterium]|nr:EF-P lysine aminoacylase GenX [Rhodospirillales bacterium]